MHPEVYTTAQKYFFMLTLTTNSIFASCYSSCVCDSGDACTTHTVGYVRDMEVIPNLCI